MRPEDRGHSIQLSSVCILLTFPPSYLLPVRPVDWPAAGWIAAAKGDACEGTAPPVDAMARAGTVGTAESKRSNVHRPVRVWCPLLLSAAVVGFAVQGALSLLGGGRRPVEQSSPLERRRRTGKRERRIKIT
jgi:hypothetical protein